ncbi:MAG: FHA domain-containing protein [Anaerolineales bacterium]|nr:FHA domain-containing protein [Anaerolineales bacterium]
MPSRRPRFASFSRLFWLPLLLVSLLWPAPALAQDDAPGAARAQLTGVNSAAFPEISAFVRVNGADGAHTAGLPAAAFTLTENAMPVSGLRVAEEAVGVQVVFVLDSTDAFKTRDANGVTRLEQIQTALTAYTQGGLRAGLDDVTILTSEGPLIEHSPDPAAVAQAVAGYTSTFAGVADPFTLLNTGLDYASDVPRQPGMARFLIFLSNGFNRPDVSGQLADAATRSAAAQAPIYTLYVGPEGGEGTTSAAHLQTLAEATGAARLLFTGPASLDPFYQMLAQYTRQYHLTYRSTLAVTGQHTLAATVSAAGTTLPAGEVVFPLRVEAPTVTLGSLPPSVVRVAAAAGADPALANPTAQDVPLTVDFPDGHPRSLQALELVVDGVVVSSAAAVTTTPSALSWPLTAYAASADHVLAVRVVDELGLAAASLPVTVTVSLQEPAVAIAPVVTVPTEVLDRPGWPLLALALLGVLLAAAVGVLAWWALTRAQRARVAEAAQAAADPTVTVPNVIRPPSARSTPRKVRRLAPAAPIAEAATAARTEAAGPARKAVPGTAPLTAPPAPGAALSAPPPISVTQPGAPRAEGRSWLPHVALPALRWPTRPTAAPLAAAYLEVVEPGGGGAPQADIAVTGVTLTLGRDAALAEAVFHDRSVSRLHARLVHANGVFRLYDAGSTSGTWINYSPIANGAGPELKHGDLINLGRVQLRFKRHDAAPDGNRAAPRIIALAPSQNGNGQGAHLPPADAPATSSDAPATSEGVATQPVEKTE